MHQVHAGGPGVVGVGVSAEVGRRHQLAVKRPGTLGGTALGAALPPHNLEAEDFQRTTQLNEWRSTCEDVLGTRYRVYYNTGSKSTGSEARTCRRGMWCGVEL